MVKNKSVTFFRCDSASDTLRGGADMDTYHAGSNDIIDDFDGKGRIFLPDGTQVSNRSFTLEAGSDDTYRDGELRVRLQTQPDGSQTLLVLGAGSLTVRNFRRERNDFGIQLNANTPAIERTLLLGSEEDNSLGELSGGDSDDEIRALAGDDRAFGGGGSDRILGGDGNDLIVANITAGAFDTDWSFTRNAPANPDNLRDPRNYILNDIAVDTDAFNNPGLIDEIAPNSLFGEGGDDDLIGGAGDDYIDGGTGNDTALGGDGNDVMYGGDGNDHFRGDGGADRKGDRSIFGIAA